MNISVTTAAIICTILLFIALSFLVALVILLIRKGYIKFNIHNQKAEFNLNHNKDEQVSF